MAVDTATATSTAATTTFYRAITFIYIFIPFTLHFLLIRCLALVSVALWM